MARKKKEANPGDGPFNPYYGKFKEESHMAEKPFFTWILIIPGLGLGFWLGSGTGEMVMGLICGAVFGIALGSLIDKWFDRRRAKKNGDEVPKGE